MKIAWLPIFLMLLCLQGRSQVHYLDTAQFIYQGVKLPAHPRLLLLAGEEKQIQLSIQSSKTWKSVHKEILRQCDSLLPLAPVEHILTGIRLLYKSRDCLFRVFHLSYAWRLTHEKKYLDRAEKELLAVARFNDWNPSHYLDVAEMTTAVAIGYDWLYNDLSSGSRNVIKDAILNKGIITSYDTAYHAYTKWLSVTNNWNQVCNTGMTYGALAIFEDQPALALKIINRSIASIDIAMKDYDPDGAFAEGYTYWGYGTTFNLMFLSAIQKVFKTDFGLGSQKGFIKTAAYLENMVGATGKCFNYSDAVETATLQPGMFWFASKLSDPSLLWLEQGFLTATNIRNISDRLLPAIMVWGKGINMNKIPPPVSSAWSGEGKNPVALFRSSWTDPLAIFIGMKGGSPSVTHGHMDAGSFVMEADGERWAMDFGMQDYTSLEEKNVSLWANKQDGQRWEVYRYSNFAHNVLTVGNSLQQVNGYAKVTGHFKNTAFLNATTDISSIYKSQLVSARRGIALVDKQFAVVRDEIETLDSTTIRWSMVTPATVTITGKQRAELKKNGKLLTLVVEGSADIILKTWSTKPPHDYDEANPGTTIVGYELKVPAKSKRQINVFLVPEKAVALKRKPVPSLAGWN